MNTNKESTSNSLKFAPMPMSALMADLMPLLQKSAQNVDSSCSSNEESDSSLVETVANKHTSKKEDKQQLHFSTPKITKNNYNNKFTSEKKIVQNDHNKENKDNNYTYPNKDCHPVNPQMVHAYPSSELKKRNVLTVQNSISKSSIKRTSESKVPTSGSKSKIVTPKIKSGIRKFTPGSARRSQKKTPQKCVIAQNKESVRCLFPEKKELTNEGSHGVLPQSQPVPETPVNKIMPASYVATPSYPQGAMGHISKPLYKITNIKGKKYMYIRKLGTGGSSEVYKVLEMGSSCEYAVKCVDLATDQELANGYINEVRLLRELQKSDRVIRLYDYEYDRARQCLRLVLEAGETDLASLMRARGAGLPPALVLHYWEEMLHAVHYIHEHGVIHADLKPANFLLVCGRLKLIDFGIASAVSGDATSVVRAHAAGTYSYISPEALAGGAGSIQTPTGEDQPPIKISYRSDVWSLGCILYSMVYGRTPFAHLANLAKLAAILDPNHKIDYPPVQHLPGTLVAALKWCLTYNARARPTVRELLALPYLSAAGERQPLPQPLLDRLRPLVSPHDYGLLLRAQLPPAAP